MWGQDVLRFNLGGRAQKLPGPGKILLDFKNKIFTREDKIERGHDYEGAEEGSIYGMKELKNK